MRQGFDPALIRAASLHVQSLDMEKEAVLNMIPGLVARATPMLRTAGSAASNFASRAASGGVTPLVSGFNRARAGGAGLGSSVLRGVRGQASYLTGGASNRAIASGQQLLQKGIQTAGSGAKLTGGVLGAGMVVSAMPQMAATASNTRRSIVDSYGNEGGY